MSTKLIQRYCLHSKLDKNSSWQKQFSSLYNFQKLHFKLVYLKNSEHFQDIVGVVIVFHFA